MAEVLTDGDHGFIGVNSRMDPSQLPAGMCSFAKNVRFDRGVARPRKGIRKVPWLNRYDELLADASKVLPLGKPLGAAMFRDATYDAEWLIVATGSGVWKVRAGALATTIPLPAGVDLSGLSRVNLIQCFGTMILQRGEDAETLVMTDLNTGFKSVGAVTLSGTEIKIPDSDNAAFIGNRLYVPHGTDLIFPSDLLDYTKGTILNDFKINQGSNDKLVGIFKFNDTTLIAGKRRSIYVVSNLYGDLSDARLDLLTNEYGLAGPKAFAAVGSDVWFLARGRGVVSIRQTSDNKLQGVDLPVSDPIQDLIERINWDHAVDARAAFHDNKFFLAVPIDTPEKAGQSAYLYATALNMGVYISTWWVQKGRTYSVTTGANFTSLTNGTTTVTDTGTYEITAAGDLLTVRGSAASDVITITEKDYSGFNNAVLVYDTINRAWSGYDEADALTVVDFVKFPYGEEERLGFLGEDGFMNLYEDGFHDWDGAPSGTLSRAAVATDLVTRGYLNNPADRMHFTRASLVVSTWWPSYSTSLLTDGHNEEIALGTGVTRDRTKYHRPWNAADFVEDNSNDDFLEPWRQDYSVRLDGSEEIDCGSNGVDPDIHQEWEDSRVVRARGRYARLRVQGAQGRTEVRVAGVQGHPDSRRLGMKA